MEAVVVKTLKAQLSAYVAKARTGKRIIITDRGEEVAELGKVTSNVCLSETWANS